MSTNNDFFKFSVYSISGQGRFTGINYKFLITTECSSKDEAVDTLICMSLFDDKPMYPPK